MCSVKEAAVWKRGLVLLASLCLAVVVPLNGTHLSFEADEGEACQIDFAIAVDGSGSIEVDNPVKGNWQKVINFLSEVVAGFDIGPDLTRVAMVKFDEQASLYFDLDQYSTKNATLGAVMALDYNRAGGRTNTDGALRLIRNRVFKTEHGDRPDVRNVLMIMTDGQPTPDLNAGLQDTVTALKADSVRIVGIGVTAQVNEAFMRQLVSNSETDYFSVNDFGQLSQILDDIVTQSCRVVTDCRSEADVYVVMDGSGSIDEANFLIMKEFAASFIYGGLNLNMGLSKAGVVLFSDNATMLADLNEFEKRDPMETFVMGMRYPRGATRTDLAIKLVRELGFTAVHGDRPNVPNVLVLITDGNSNQPQATFAEAASARRAGIHIITVGVGSWINDQEMKLISSFPSSINYIHVPQFLGLNENLRKIVTDLVCNNINECNQGPCSAGGTCIDLIGTYSCHCAPGTGGRNCQGVCLRQADVLLALDSSGSVGRTAFMKELEFVRELVASLNIAGVRVAALQYSDTAIVQINLNDFNTRSGLLDGLSMLYQGGTTNTAAALAQRTPVFASSAQRPNTTEFIVVFLDGRSNDFEATWHEARAARAAGVHIIAVGVGSDVSRNELLALASYPDPENIVLAANYTQLGAQLDTMLNLLCQNTDACSSNPCRNGGACRRLPSGYQCLCAVGFSGRPCERACNKRYDIVLAVDVSGSIRNERIEQVIEFLVSFVSEFEISADAARFGVVTFSDNETLQFHLNSYSSLQDVVTALRLIRFRGGKTNIASALQLISEVMFVAGNGDRPDVSNYVVLVTDGASNVREADVIPLAIDMRRRGTSVMSLGIGSDVNMLEMKGMTSLPHNKMMMVAQSFNDMGQNQHLRSQMLKSLVDATCDSVNNCSPNPCQNGATCFDLLHSHNCQCVRPFSGQNCTRTCNKQLDVVFVLDFSGSLQQVSEVVVALTRQVVQGLPFFDSSSRVGVVTFADNARSRMTLTTYTSKLEVLNALSFSDFGGRTNTQEALRMVVDEVFTANGGDRASVPNIAIVVTDGGSNMQRPNTRPMAIQMQSNVEVYVAAVFFAPDMGEVNDLASDPDSEYVVLVPDAASVPAAANQLLDLLCA